MAPGADRDAPIMRVKGRMQQGEPFIGHQATEIAFGKPARRGHIKGRIPLGERKAPVMRQHLTGGQRHGFHGLG